LACGENPDAVICLFGADLWRHVGFVKREREFAVGALDGSL
jgi:hypothetical protein